MGVGVDQVACPLQPVTKAKAKKQEKKLKRKKKGMEMQEWDGYQSRKKRHPNKHL